MKISFYVLAYNHSNLIERAISGALNQKCESMQIIISDDFSTDDTWEKIQLAVSDYKGPHEVVIRRNEQNLGIAEHINKIWSICRGDWIFASAGDDWSDPSRVAKTIQLVADNPHAMLVQTWMNEVDENDRLLWVNDTGKSSKNIFEKTKISDRLINSTYSGHGAAMAYSRQLISVFGNLPRDVIFEDNILSLRAELLGDLLVLKMPLVNHTNHDGQITRVLAGVSPAIREKRRLVRLVSDISSTMQNYKDVQRAIEIKDRGELFKLIDLFSRRLEYFENKHASITGRWPIKIFGIVSVFRDANKYGALAKDDLLRALLPYPLYRIARKIRDN